MKPRSGSQGGRRGRWEGNGICIMLLGTFQELERFTATFLTQLFRTFEVTNLGTGGGGDR